MPGPDEYVSFVSLLGESFHTRYFQSEGRDATPSLSVVAGPSFFQYAVFDAGFTRLTELAHVESRDKTDLGADPSALTFLLQNFSLAGKKFARVNVALLQNEFVMLPPAFAGRDDARELLAFAGQSREPSVTLSHQAHDVGFCWRNDPEVMQSVERALNNATVRHAGAVSIGLLGDHPAVRNCGALLNVQPGMTEIVFRKNDATLFYNVFPVSTIEDTLYYLLFTAGQFEIDPAKLNLAVAGVLPLTSELVTWLRRYTAQVTFVSSHENISVEGKLKEIPSHYYFTLLNQHLCEL